MPPVSPEESTPMVPELKHTISVKMPSGEWRVVNPERIEDGKTIYSFFPVHQLSLSWTCVSPATDNWAGSVRFIYYPQSTFSTGHAGAHEEQPFLFRDQNGIYPPDKFSIPPTPKNTPFVLYFSAPVSAVKFSATAESINCGGQITRDEFIIKVPKLNPLPPGGAYPNKKGYELVDMDPTHHPSPHNTSSQMKKELVDAGLVWWTVCSPLPPFLQYQRMSLPLGGAFDKYYNWYEPYFGHIWGEAADIGKNNIHQADREILINILCNNLDVWSETDLADDPGPSRYHVARRDLPVYAINSGPNPESSVYCCTEEGAILPKPCINLGKGFAESKYLSPSCPANLDRQLIKKLFNELTGPAEGQ